MSFYLKKVSKKEEHDACVRYCQGGCAIFAYALWKLLPDWEICIFSGELDHVVLYNPEYDMCLDYHGLQNFEEKAKSIFDRADWKDESDDGRVSNSADFLNMNNPIDYDLFFEMTSNYKIIPDKEVIEQLIKETDIQFWANRIVALNNLKKK